MACFSDLGSHCAECGRQDFCPTTCNVCNKSFCIAHYHAWKHTCKDVEQAKRHKISTTETCAVQKCGQKLTISNKIQCDRCLQWVCISHRHEWLHDCRPSEVPTALPQKRPAISGTKSSLWCSVAECRQRVSDSAKQSCGQCQKLCCASHFRDHQCRAAGIDRKVLRVQNNAETPTGPHRLRSDVKKEDDAVSAGNISDLQKKLTESENMVASLLEDLIKKKAEMATANVLIKWTQKGVDNLKKGSDGVSGPELYAQYGSPTEGSPLNKSQFSLFPSKDDTFLPLLISTGIMSVDC